MKKNLLNFLREKKQIVKLSVMTLFGAAVVGTAPICMACATVKEEISESHVVQNCSSETGGPAVAGSLSVSETTEDTGATKKPVKKADVPEFVPKAANASTAKEERKSILIVGAHPENDRWKGWWQPLAEKYDLTFIQDELPVSFKSNKGVSVVEKDQLLGEIAYSPDRRVEVLKFDFNDENFALAMIKHGKKFDLIINDYSVYNFFRDEKATVVFTSLLKQNGYCVLGPLGSRDGEYWAYSTAPPPQKEKFKPNSFDTCIFDVICRKCKHKVVLFSWNIGSTEMDKNQMLDLIKKEGSPYSYVRDWEHLLKELKREFTVERATNFVNVQLILNSLMMESLEGWSEINPIQPFVFDDIADKVKIILPPLPEGVEADPTSTWMIISPKK